MKRITFARLAVLLLAVAGLALSGCGGDDNGGLSAEDMARIDAAEMAAMEAEMAAMEAEEAAMMADQEAEAEAEALRMELADLQMQLAEAQAMQEADDTSDLIATLTALIMQLEARINQEGIPSTPTQNPMTGPQVDIGVEHVTGLTEAAMGEFITNSPIESRLTPEHYLSMSYDTERRHYGVALVNGTAAVGFGGRQYLDGAETYGGWMEFNHFGVFPGIDDDGREFTDLWSIGERSGSNPGGTELEWNGVFVGREMLHATQSGDRMRGPASISVVLGDPLMPAPLNITRAQLRIGTDMAGGEIVNIDNSAVDSPYPYGMQTGVFAAPGEWIIPVEGGMFMQGSDVYYAHMNDLDAEVGTFTVEGSFYGNAQQEAGGIFSFTDNTDGSQVVDDDATYRLIGAFGADRRGN